MDSLGCHHSTSLYITQHLQLTKFSIQSYLISPNRNSSYIHRFCPTRWIEDKPVAERGIVIWKNFVKVISHWEGLCKSSQPPVKCYETLVNHYWDPLIPIKMQFFSFIAGIFRPYLTIFQTDTPMVPFMRDEVEAILNQLLCLIFWKDALDKAGTPLKRLTKTKHHLEDGLGDLGATTKDFLKKIQISAERKRKFKGLYKHGKFFWISLLQRKVYVLICW